MPASPISASKKTDLKRLQESLLQGDRTALGQAITLVESDREQDRLLAEQLVEAILPAAGNSIRIGITGSPGVGKSTFIEKFGSYVTTIGKKVAVLTIDPSSQKTKGSILGDKTRMEDLSRNPSAFIRPTAAGEHLGGIAMGTRESVLLCEAAGYDVILIETVGVGQSEVAVRSMVDFFLLLLLAGAGDELQGIKKGIMEIADGLVITKADGDNVSKAKQAQAEFQHALHLFQAPESGWTPAVMTASAIDETGIMEVWRMIESYVQFTRFNGFFIRQRNDQLIQWFHEGLQNFIRNKILSRSRKHLSDLEKQIVGGLSPNAAVRKIIGQLKI